MAINLEKKYVSVDVETSGKSPGKYSMLSLGACIVGDTAKQFYVELKPISEDFIFDYIRVGSKGLRCLEGKGDHVNPESPYFNPNKVLGILQREGMGPKEAMANFAEWVKEATIGYRAIELAAPIKFDGMFTAWYFDNFYDGENPLGYSGEDINSMYRGVAGDILANVKDFNMREKNPYAHNALEDAIIQAKEFEKVLVLMRIGKMDYFRY